MLVGVLHDQRIRHGDRLLLLPYLIDTLGVAVGRPCPSYWRAKAWNAWLAWEAPRGPVDAVSRVDGLRLLGGDVSIVAAQLGADDGCG